MKSIILLLLSLCLIGNIFSQPINNTCASATVLVESPSGNCSSAAGTTIGATITSELFVSEAGTTTEDRAYVWYSFTPDSTSKYTVDIIPNIGNAGWTVTTGNCGDTLQIIKSASIYYNEPVLLQKDSAYLLVIHTNSETEFDLCLYKTPPPPPNDSCINATVLMRSPIDNCAYISGTTISATTTSEVYISESDTSMSHHPTVWYSFIPDSSGLYDLEIDEKESTTAYWQATTGDCSDTLVIIKDLYSYDNVAALEKDSVYHFLVSSYTPTDFDICLYKLPPPPPNDSCINATVLMESPADNCAYISGTTVSATKTSEVYISESDTSSAYQAFVWYSFIPDSSGNYSLDVNTDDDLFSNYLWQVTTGDCSDTLVIIKDLYSYNNFVTLQKDSSYLFSIYTSSATTFELCLYKTPPPPPNDSCTTAIELIAGDIGQCNAISGTTQGATFSIQNVRSLDGSIYQAFFPAVWYEFTPDSTANYTLDVLADLPNATSNLNKVNFWLILTGSCQDTLNEVAQLIPNIGINTIRFEKNTTYYFAGYFVDLGQFDILETEFDICISQAASHENDACTTSLPLSTGCTTGTTVNASSNLDEVIFDLDGYLMTSGFPIVWYKLIPDATGVYSFSMSNNSRGYNGMLLLTGSCNDTLLTKSSFINIGVDSLVKDSTYFLAVSIADTVDFIGYTEFEFELCIEFCAPPTNDLWSDAISLQESDTASCQNAEAGTTLCATTPQRFGYPGVWYEFTPDSTKMYSLSVYGTSAAVIGYMSILTSSDINSRIALGSNNISSQLSKGTTYYIYAGAVDPSFGSAQPFNICISEDPNPNQILSNSQRGDAEFSAPIIYSTQSIKSGDITYSASDYLEVLRKFEIFNESTLTVNIGPYNNDRLKSQNVVRSKEVSYQKWDFLKFVKNIKVRLQNTLVKENTQENNE